ncbi:MAG: hypothetical protein R3D29_08275 [Nitratireductor sp.]
MAGKQKEYPEVPMGLEQGPFHARIAERNFQHAWTNWMGFASPSVLDTVEFEYFAIRNQCTVRHLADVQIRHRRSRRGDCN